MSDKDKQEAQELAARAAAQGKHAAKNAGRAAKAGASVAAEKIGDEAEIVNEKAEETVRVMEDTARRASPRIIRTLTSDTGIGFFALSVSIYAGTIAFSKFNSAYSNRRYPYSRGRRSAPPGHPHGRPSV